jgi:ATPase subunit of ABC transporter with duplicated ATPase domains
MVLVSHDRAFLDAVCTDIIHFSHQKLTYYPGNFSAFEQRQAEKASREAQILDSAERKRTKALEFVERHQHAGSKKHGFDPNKQRQAKTIREKKLDRIGNYREDGKRYKNYSLKKLSEDYLLTAQQVEVEAVEAAPRFKLPNPVLPTSLKEDDTIISFDGVSFAYSKHSPKILKGVSFQIRVKSKIAVVGRNGSGKSTGESA